jgi:acyl-CoA-dependent ceramide synthase
LRYLGYKKACDAAFVVFLVGWILTRQIGFAMVTYSAAVNAPKFIAFDWNPAKQHYFTKSVHTAFIVLLCLLLTLCTIWFYMAIMVAVRVVRGQGAEDTRSDSEDFAENDEDDEVEHRGNGHANGHANGNGAANGHKSHALNGHALNGHGALNGHATVLSTSAPNGYASANGLKRRL